MINDYTRLAIVLRGRQWCEACTQAYDEGGLVCPHHEAMIDADLQRFGQPATLDDQYRNGHGIPS